MKKTVILIAILALAGSVAFGQDVVPSVNAGSMGVLFQFSGLANLAAGAYQGGIGGKFFLTDRTAIRVAAEFQYASDNDKAHPTAGQRGIDGSASGTTFGLLAAIEYHLGKGRARPYVGAGALFSTTSTDYKPMVTGANPIQSETKNTPQTLGGITFTPATTFGVAGVIGVEFFLYKELSISAEYQIMYGMQTNKDVTYSSGIPGQPTITSYASPSSGSKLGIFNDGSLILTAYF
jgi:opacity protein-like surface antigen